MTSEIPKRGLRTAQKAQTRQRILNAARKMFFKHGYHETTVDQIVAAVGASRQTFYDHFADKQAILNLLVEEYRAGSVAIMLRFPAPAPTVEQIRDWLLDVAKFFKDERASRSLLVQLGAHPSTGSTYGKAGVSLDDSVMDLWILTLGRRAGSFAAAAGEGPGAAHALAQARLLTLQTIFGASLAWELKGSDLAEATLRIVAQAFHAFVHDRDYADHPVDERPA